MKTLCTLNDVTKRYPGRTESVLGPLSLTVQEKTVTGIRGENGAGKSTLLAIMANVLKPTAGKVTYISKKIKIGYVPQELSLYESMSGRENLIFWGLASGLSRKAAEKQSLRLLESMDLLPRAEDETAAYSGGMKRRLHLASALMVRPDLLLLDEPTVGADTESADLILRVIHQLRAQGTGCVLISHQPGELEQVCDRILTLKKGMIEY